jgi:hypothetical protein
VYQRHVVDAGRGDYIDIGCLQYIQEICFVPVEPYLPRASQVVQLLSSTQACRVVTLRFHPCRYRKKLSLISRNGFRDRYLARHDSK